jgi:hypothetical protein
MTLNFNETHSPVMNGITFQYLISLAIQKYLSLQLIDVVIAYLYELLDSDLSIYVSMHSPLFVMYEYCLTQSAILVP